uniref:Otopetrin n=2 Tax=Clastoptera arizonana TaxID=38151 RepID=A0A1B6EG22_9HEMI
MVYSGLELGQYLDVNRKPECKSLTPAVTSALRMMIILFQMQFIFLNNKNMDLCQSYAISRFGLMHMIATNICEWLNVIVQETKHEINFLEEEILQGHHKSLNSTSALNCDHGEIMGNIVHNVSPFLFPCTIEYSLICAVIMLEIWKHVKVDQHSKVATGRHPSRPDILANKAYHFSIDCSSAHKGLFGGIVVVVFTIISLIIFFVLQGIPEYHDTGRFELNVWEFCLHALSTVAVVMASIQMRKLHYKGGLSKGLGLDNTLLVLAQGGVYMYSAFSMIGVYFTTKEFTALLSETFNVVQATLQTLFILEAWSRRSRNHLQWTKKPGRPMITFLLITNMAIWIVNSLEKNRAQFRPNHLQLFGIWAWTIITHVSMPLAIFYRFHSTICLFEIWKNAYKMPNNKMTPQHSFSATQI